MINQHGCGVAVAPDDPKGLADALQKMASDKEGLKEMSQNGKKLAEDQFNRDDLSNQFAEFLIEVAQK